MYFKYHLYYTITHDNFFFIRQTNLTSRLYYWFLTILIELKSNLFFIFE